MTTTRPATPQALHSVQGDIGRAVRSLLVYLASHRRELVVAQREHGKDETMDALGRQIAAFEEMRDLLETDHLGKWVVFHGGKLIDTYESSEEAVVDAVARFGRGPYLIRQVGAPPAQLPPSVWPRPAV